MPEDEQTQFSTPIPLRDNGSDERPNPWTRLEAADRVYSRVHALRELLVAAAEAPNRVALQAVLEILDGDLFVALYGTLPDVRAVAAGAPIELWVQTAKGLLWPPATTFAGWPAAAGGEPAPGAG